MARLVKKFGLGPALSGQQASIGLTTGKIGLKMSPSGSIKKNKKSRTEKKKNHMYRTETLIDEKYIYIQKHVACVFGWFSV